ncbi:MAG TPA: ATP-grasp domain-containing protein [Tissierellales bacterium]|nr:ATP-grasp domain-containing protein [Tissierellales bacterium]
MKIGIITDKPRAEFLPTEEGLLEDKQKRKTVKQLKETISKKYDCINLVFDDNAIKRLKGEKVDLVFNLCNGIRGNSRLSQLPAMLESAGIPYTSSSPLGHGLAQDKIYSGLIFKKLGIPTPNFIYVYNIDEIKDLEFNFPVLVKPKNEGSSRGIHEDSLVFNKESLIKIIGEQLKTYNPPIMITKYIEGKEFTVGVMGNSDNISVLPILEIDFSNIPNHLNKFYSFEVKVHYGEQTKYYVPARIKKETENNIKKMAVKAYKALNMRDYARIDFRLNEDNIPYVLEINSLPGLMKGHSDLCKMAGAAGLNYDGLVMKIVNNAVKRYGLDEN